MGLTVFREDILAMENINEAKRRIHIQRAFSYSRLGPELMSSAYESLVPTRQMPLCAEKQTKNSGIEKERRWAM
jgi:hypothetical protein